MGIDGMIPRHVYDKHFVVIFFDRSERKYGFQPNQKGGLIWYTDGTKTSKDTGTGVYGYTKRQKRSFILGQYTTVFRAEMCAIKACTVENLDRNNRNRNIYILSESQAAIPRVNGQT
jgi:hypothetical protein